MAFPNGACPQSEDLGAVDKLDKILEEDENTEGGDEEDKIGRLLGAKGTIGKSIYTDPQQGRKRCGKKKLAIGFRRREITRL